MTTKDEEYLSHLDELLARPAPVGMCKALPIIVRVPFLNGGSGGHCHQEREPWEGRWIIEPDLCRPDRRGDCR